MDNGRTIQVFEFGWLIVNEKYGEKRDIVFKDAHFKLLARYLTENFNCPYYTVYFDRIRFANYVGVLKVGDLTIEVLPKTDKHEASKSQWQKVLLQMLAISLDVKAKTTTHADVILRSHSVLEAYLNLFLNETERLLHEGLVKKYRTDIGNKTSLKGKLLMHQHISKNLVHAERFYVAHQVYDRDNIFNSILSEALNCIRSLGASNSISKYCSTLLLNFPECRPINISQKLFERLQYNRKTERYRKAIELARIILLNYHPDVKGGSNNILAIMFDMNFLWESYIYKMLSKASRAIDKKCVVLDQQRTLFWKHPDKWSLNLVPDLLICFGDSDRFILDTKWKYKKDTSPEDIRQMYAYGNYFRASRRYLLYPDKLEVPVVKKEGSFYKISEKEVSESEKCGLIYADLLNKDNTLNMGIGLKILESIEPE